MPRDPVAGGELGEQRLVEAVPEDRGDRAVGGRAQLPAPLLTGTSDQPDWLEGTLESQPRDMSELPQGAILRLPRSHVIDVVLCNPARMPPTIKPKRQYWERCLVDQCVLDSELKVGYLYREAPDMTYGGDKFPDSGWRIRGDTRGPLKEQLGSRKVAYVALGAALNRDDSWLHLIDEPVGARFEKDFEKGVFVPEK